MNRPPLDLWMAMNHERARYRVAIALGFHIKIIYIQAQTCHLRIGIGTNLSKTQLTRHKTVIYAIEDIKE